MMKPDLMDDIDCGGFFDHIDDLLDFPEELDAGGLGDPNSFPSIWTQPHPDSSSSLPASTSVLSAAGGTTDLSAELAVPYDDILQMEWLSNFVEDSFSAEGLTINEQQDSLAIPNDSSTLNQFQIASPVSVLESSSSCSIDKTLPRNPKSVVTGKRGRARSKRARPASFNPRPAIQLLAPAETASVTHGNVGESRLVIKIPKHAVTDTEQKKKKRIKITPPRPNFVVENKTTKEDEAPIRKCMHCEGTKTPQWRAGPMGPKTLCNACGVRHKSGRLFPEYRPAASPTFTPVLHSNSHKKVLEMRNQNENKVQVKRAESESTEFPVLIPNYNNIGLNYM